MATAIRWLAALTAVLVLIQATLIGQSLFLGNPGMLALHGWVGNVTLLAALVLAALTAVAVRQGEASVRMLGLIVLVVLLLVAQLGLGYAGRRGGMPAALHIPNGVLIVALLGALTALAAVPARVRSALS